MGGAAPVDRARPRAWVVTTGEAGMLAQARGLARCIDPAAHEVTVRLRPPYAVLPGMPGLLRFGLDPQGSRPAPPWPDLVVSCGRRAARVALAIGAASGGRCVLVHVQDPRCDPARFDLVVAMGHDTVDGPNVLKVLTALNEIRPGGLAEAAARWRPRFGRVPSPRVGVLLGGPTRHGGFTRRQAGRLGRELAALRARDGGGLLITSSRRTPAGWVDTIRRELGTGDDVWLWDGCGENPYGGILALSDRLVVTGDSVSMISEAIASGRPVEVFAPAARGRHRRLLAALAAAGLAGAFGAERVPGVAFNETGRAAAAVRALLQSRSGRDGNASCSSARHSAVT